MSGSRATDREAVSRFRQPSSVLYVLPQSRLRRDRSQGPNGALPFVLEVPRLAMSAGRLLLRVCAYPLLVAARSITLPFRSPTRRGHP